MISNETQRLSKGSFPFKGRERHAADTRTADIAVDARLGRNIALSRILSVKYNTTALL